MSPVVYDTAWVARVPKHNNLSEPEFPAALEWVRNQQLSNGAWDIIENEPYLQGTTLSILAAVIALAQWNKPQDKLRVERGLTQLHKIAEQLLTEAQGSAGFDLLLGALHNDAKALGLSVPSHIYQVYEDRTKKRSELPSSFFAQPHAGWFTLEMFGSNFFKSKEQLIAANNTVGDNGSVATSPAASAYLLRENRLQGMDLPQVNNYLKQQMELHQNAVAHIAPLDIMELTFGINFFLRGGISATSDLLAPAVKRLISWFDMQNGVGWSKHFLVSDSDNISLSNEVFFLIGHQTNINLVKPFFQGNYFTCYPIETIACPAVTMNVLTTLQLFNNKGPEFDSMVTTTINWLESVIHIEGYFTDRWHLSPFYANFRAVFALRDLNNGLAKRVVNWIIGQQHSDGGWGINNVSTAEETAYAVLSLLHWQKKHPEQITTVSLKQAKDFIDQASLGIPLWPGKVLYYPVYMVEAIVLSARYALTNSVESLQVA